MGSGETAGQHVADQAAGIQLHILKKYQNMQSFDFFRKVRVVEMPRPSPLCAVAHPSFGQVPRDFTEGTAPGSALSIIATIVMTALFFLELKNYLTVKIVTDIVMDPGSKSDNDLAINFDLTMPELVRTLSGCGTARLRRFPIPIETN